MDVYVLTAILLAAVVLYVTRWLPIEVTSLLLPPALMLSGILDPGQALSGFSNAATVTIAALFVISAGLTRTGTLDGLTAFIRDKARGSPLRLVLLLAVTVPFISAFMNNIPVVAMLVPVVLVLARDLEAYPSKLMIPLSYFAILGGTCTLIGTGTNILVHDFYKTWQADQGLPVTGFGMFEFTGLGLVLLAAGTTFLLTVGRSLLPERTSLTALLPASRTAHFVTEVRVDEDSAVAGRYVRDVFPQDAAVGLLELVRDERVLEGPAARPYKLKDGDALIVSGPSAKITEFLSHSKTSLASVVEDERRVPMRTVELFLAEAVILPDSPFVGRTIAGIGLNRTYGAKVLAVQRAGRHRRKEIVHMRLRVGDVLLLQASAEAFSALRESESVLLVEGLETAIKHRRRAPVALIILVAVVASAALTPLPIAIAALAGAGLMLATRCLRPDEAFRALDPSVLLLLCGTIPLGVAMEATGLARDLVHILTANFGGAGPWVLLSGFYLLTSVITEFLSNKATAVLLAPIALQMGASLGVDPKPFLMAVCFAASASFTTPIGYPTNLIVFGPGGYLFKDYLKIGIPMNLLMWILASLLIPVLWPFAV